MNFKRILFKISGEALAGDKNFGYDTNSIWHVVNEIGSIHRLGIQLCLVVGGGNIFRGAFSKEMDRNNADHMGMLATIMNGIALRDALTNYGIPTEIQSALAVDRICGRYNLNKAIYHMNNDKVILFVAGTGNPFFTTDTASVLRASEMKCDAVLKGTQVDGIYEEDPKKVPNAKRYKTITFDDTLKKNLAIMDQTAFALAKSNNVPIVVFKLSDDNAVLNVVNNRCKYTLVSNDVETELDS